MIKADPVDIRVTVLFVLHVTHGFASWDTDQRLACPLLIVAQNEATDYLESSLTSITDHMSSLLNSLVALFCRLHTYRMDQPKRRSAQQARHNYLRFAYGAASAHLRPASQVQ